MTATLMPAYRQALADPAAWEALDQELRLSPMGDTRNREVPCRYCGPRRPGTWNIAAVCTRHHLAGLR